MSNNTGIGSKILFSGHFNVPHDIPGPMELTLDTNQCDTSFKQCDKYPSFRIPAFCQKLKDKKAFYYDAVSKVHPPFDCPLTAQNYVLNNGTVDLSALAFVPLSESVWLLTSKLYAGKTRELILCVTAEFKIKRNRGRKKP